MSFFRFHFEPYPMGKEANRKELLETTIIVTGTDGAIVRTATVKVTVR